MYTNKKPILVITGPTTSGKSELGVFLAKRYNGEVISADSRQIYERLDEGSGKITKEEMEGIPHYMLSIAKLGQTYSAHDFVNDALPIIEELHSRDKLPIIVGGTGFYIDALIYSGGTADVPANPKLRNELMNKSIEDLSEMLEKKDKKIHRIIDKNNPRRLIRAIEIIEAIGHFPKKQRYFRYPTTIIGITYPRKDMKQRITERLDKRWEGIKKEVKTILDSGVDSFWLENLGLEYRYATRLIRDQMEEEKIRENLITAIFAYAKRQETWWKRYKEITFFHPKQRNEILKILDRKFK